MAQFAWPSTPLCKGRLRSGWQNIIKWMQPIAKLPVLVYSIDVRCCCDLHIEAPVLS